MAKLLTLAGAGNAGSLLPGPAGFYWHDGNLASDTARLNLSNYAQTTKFGDGSTGDQTTFESATDPTNGMYVREISPLIALGEVVFTVYTDSNLGWSAYVWNGTSYVTEGWVQTGFPLGGPSPSWRTFSLAYSGDFSSSLAYLDYSIYIYTINELAVALGVGDVRRT